MKKRTAALLAAAIMTLPCVGCNQDTNAPGGPIKAEELTEKWGISRTADKNKVILDIDMMYVNDDAYAVLVAAQADALGYIDLLGITSTTGNAFASASLYDTLYLLGEIGRTDIPVFWGETAPRNGFADVEKIKKECGLSAWYGCYRSIDRYTDDIYEAYQSGICGAKGGIKDAAPADGTAVDFIIEQIHRYPGEVTLITLAPLTTVSKAIEKDPTIVDDAAGIAIMGGDFGAAVDELRDFEFNTWFDPEAANMVLAAPWKECFIASSDAAVSCRRDKEVYDLIKSKNTGKASRCIVDFLAPTYENGKEEAMPYCWDPVAVVYYLCPDIAKTVEQRAFCVDEREGMTYGLSRDWAPGTSPEGVSDFPVVLACDGAAFWDFISDIYSIDP